MRARDELALKLVVLGRDLHHEVRELRRVEAQLIEAAATPIVEARRQGRLPARDRDGAIVAVKQRRIPRLLGRRDVAGLEDEQGELEDVMQSEGVLDLADGEVLVKLVVRLLGEVE